jgi:hypothetical protein
MKKKHRDIVVDGITYGWIGGWGWARIYKDKKLWFNYNNDDGWILPSMVADAIKEWLKKNK